MDYDTWFDYLRLLESEGDFPSVREAYEKAIAQIPPIQVCSLKNSTSNRFILFPIGETILASIYLSLDKLCSFRRIRS